MVSPADTNPTTGTASAAAGGGESNEFFNRVFSVYGGDQAANPVNLTLPSHAAVFLISEKHQKKLKQFLDPQEKLKHRHAALLAILGTL